MKATFLKPVFVRPVRLAVMAALLAASSGCATRTITRQQASDAGEAWVKAFNSNNVEAVSAFYGQAPFFLPTISPKLIMDAASTQEYFRGLFGSRPGIQATIDTQEVALLGEEALLTGMGTFNWPTSTGQAAGTLKFRYSFVLQQTANGIQVLHHHNSVLPQ
ncbi:MAG: nuclear transport factor 2 family protein [Limisphaerales bacterium]